MNPQPTNFEERLNLAMRIGRSYVVGLNTSYKKLCEKYNCSPGTIHRYLHEYLPLVDKKLYLKVTIKAQRNYEKGTRKGLRVIRKHQKEKEVAQ